jgi:hypothetical protein
MSASAASRKGCSRISEDRGGGSEGGRRINNPPQVNNLPHEQASAREELD